ncbi:MAG: hypothetical protein P8N76_09075 [Pirellulaceae bacterium]|nr:hypothetical protein [Pirellulaceae bacterium]
MSGYSRIRRQQLMQEAEGYLDLIMATSDQSPLCSVLRCKLAQRAIDALDRLEANESNHGRACYLRGQAYRFMERYDLAIDVLVRSSQFDPSNTHIYLALAWCFKRMGRLDLAIESMEDALEVDTCQGIIYYNLACYWSLASNVGLTLAHLARAFDLDPDYRNLVFDEPDFNPVRNHPEFLALTSVIV